MQRLPYFPTDIVELGSEKQPANTSAIQAQPDAIEVLGLASRINLWLEVLVVIDHRLALLIAADVVLEPVGDGLVGGEGLQLLIFLQLLEDGGL